MNDLFQECVEAGRRGKGFWWGFFRGLRAVREAREAVDRRVRVETGRKLRDIVRLLRSRGGVLTLKDAEQALISHELRGDGFFDGAKHNFFGLDGLDGSDGSDDSGLDDSGPPVSFADDRDAIRALAALVDEQKMIAALVNDPNLRATLRRHDVRLAHATCGARPPIAPPHEGNTSAASDAPPPTTGTVRIT